MMAWRVQAEDGSRVGVCLRFAYPTGKHTDDACDWTADKNHRTELVSSGAKSALLRRTIDSTIYYVSLKWDENAVLREKAPNYWVLTAEGGLLTYTCEYLPVAEGAGSETFSDVAALSANHWQTFWSEGAAVDFSQCTDARAPELERRVVLSQYLLAIQCCGNTPPQETGLTYNSWFGKFHMEMIWWHGNDMVAPGLVAAMGTCRPLGAHPAVVLHRRTRCPSYSPASGFPWSTLDEDDRPQRRGSTVEGRQLPRVATAPPNIPCRVSV